MSDEKRVRVLQMLKDGLIDVEEANELLEAVKPEETQVTVSEAPAKKYKFLKIVVDAIDDEDAGGKTKSKAKVRVNIPLSLARTGIKMIPQKAREEMERHGVSADDIVGILDHLDEFEGGDIVNVEASGNETGSENGAANVRIYLE